MGSEDPAQAMEDVAALGWGGGVRGARGHLATGVGSVAVSCSSLPPCLSQPPSACCGCFLFLQEIQLKTRRAAPARWLLQSSHFCSV